MWQLENLTPFQAERRWMRDKDGAETWLVAVKATYAIQPNGSVDLAQDQVPVFLSSEYCGEPGQSSVKYEADLILTKHTTDIIAVGHAYAPRGTTVTRTEVVLTVGPISKTLNVFGDRVWHSFGASDPVPFAMMPIVYERAFGGAELNGGSARESWDRRNPVGTGFAASSENAIGLRLPNIEDPKNPINSWADRPAPAGFGVIASHWQPRAGWAGTYDDHWMQTRRPLLAEDLDDRYFQCAPVDQQAPQFLRGGEPVLLRGLTTDGILSFNLPKIALGFETYFQDGTREIHKDRSLHSVILEPDFPRLSLVWHTALSCHSKAHKLERTVITQKASLSDAPPRIAGV